MKPSEPASADSWTCALGLVAQRSEGARRARGESAHLRGKRLALTGHAIEACLRVGFERGECRGAGVFERRRAALDTAFDAGDQGVDAAIETAGRLGQDAVEGLAAGSRTFGECRLERCQRRLDPAHGLGDRPLNRRRRRVRGLLDRQLLEVAGVVDRLASVVLEQIEGGERGGEAVLDRRDQRALCARGLLDGRLPAVLQSADEGGEPIVGRRPRPARRRDDPAPIQPAALRHLRGRIVGGLDEGLAIAFRCLTRGVRSGFRTPVGQVTGKELSFFGVPSSL